MTYYLTNNEIKTILHILKLFIASMEHQFSSKVLMFQLHGRTEDTSTPVNTFLQNKGIHISYTTTGTPCTCCVGNTEINFIK